MWDDDSFGTLWGDSGTGIIETNGTVAGIEGDGFASFNNNRAADGNASVISSMRITLENVTASGVIYTFTGDIGWRYGGATAAGDLQIKRNQTGFFVDGTLVSGNASALVFGDNAETSDTQPLHEYTFSYTTVSDDIGKEISFRFGLQDDDQVAGTTALLADDWQVTSIPEPATLGIVAFSALGLILIRRFRL